MEPHRTLEEIGRLMGGLTKVRVQQIEKEAVRKFIEHWHVMYPDTPCPISEELRVGGGEFEVE